MVFEGKAWKYGRDINTDLIIPARYLVTWDSDELSQHCLEDLDPDFVKKVRKGDILVAEENFGCGSSREHAPIAIKGTGISCVVAKSFARIFFRNAINIGLPILEAPEAAEEIKTGHQLRIDLSKGEIHNLSTGKIFKTQPYPVFMQQLIEQGGLVNYIRNKIKQ